MSEPQSPPTVSARTSVPHDVRHSGALPTVVTSDSVTRRHKRRDVVVTAFFAVLLVAGGGYIIFGRGGGVPTAQAEAPAATSAPATSPLASSPVSASPQAQQGSGVRMPTGDRPGWKQTFADDFTGKLTDKWSRYDGQPGGDPGGWFDPSHVTTANGELVIVGSRGKTPNGNIYITGGMNNSKVFSQVYGKYEVRFRMEQGRGVQYTIMLWPSDDSWPPEINFAEDNGKDRTMTSATLHYGATDTRIHRETNGDFTQWHTAGVEWSPGKIVYILDGEEWARMETPNVPKVPMTIAIQTQAWRCGLAWLACPNSTTPAEVKLHVDWVVAYKAQ